MSKEETFFDRLNRGEKISCTAHDEILGENNPCAIVKDLYKQLAELKAENERLKENQCPGLEFCDKDSQDTINAMLVNRDLQQQLKEKDEEINRLKSFKTRYYEMLNEKQTNTKQVCEKIRDWLKQSLMISGGKATGVDIEYAHGYNDCRNEIKHFLDQIERGEE